MDFDMNIRLTSALARTRTARRRLSSTSPLRLETLPEPYWLPITAENRAPGLHQAQKNAVSPNRETAFSLAMSKIKFVTGKEELLCPWQAWQRPTLPGLKP